jgi:outer membrane protein assembly factor BamA
MLTARLGVSFIQTKTKLTNDSLLNNFKYGDYGLGKLNPLGIHTALELEGRENPDFPLNGYYLELSGSVFPPVDNIPEIFYRAGFDIRSYFILFSAASFSFRAGGNKVWGKYPFFAGATLGGKDNLRGYNDKRFSGDAALFVQAELRLPVTELKLILKSKFGINLFIESGRVFADSEESEKWHPSYGCGIWFSYFNSEIIPSAYVAFSPDRTTFAFGLGMGF